jgi:hypothetical protein
VRRGILGWSREVARLANPAGGDPTRIAEILRTADPVSKQVMLEMAVLAVTARGRIGGIDLVRAVTESRVPIAAVVGGRDVFGGRASVQPIARGRGRRRIIVIDEAGHVDVTMGHSSVRIVRELWDFLIPRGAIS